MYRSKQFKIFSVMLLSMACSGIYAAPYSGQLEGAEAGKIKMVDGYRELKWEDLMPAGWEQPPEPKVKKPSENNFLRMLENLDDETPVVSTLDKQKVRIPGYIIPVKYNDLSVSEFLLVPYVGACIHVPPPPANQMVYVKLPKPMSAANLWDPVWVHGTLHTETIQTDYAPAGYTMQSDKVTKYEYEQK